MCTPHNAEAGARRPVVVDWKWSESSWMEAMEDWGEAPVVRSSLQDLKIVIRGYSAEFARVCPGLPARLESCLLEFTRRRPIDPERAYLMARELLVEIHKPMLFLGRKYLAELDEERRLVAYARQQLANEPEK